ncbi:MAG TPA: YCF48-related protein [Terriglobales bacterium]|nr:YCF48-related protein [Terriglobales bacterium]
MSLNPSHAISRKSLILLAVALFLSTASWAAQWTVLGPDGGDARSLGHDPKNPDHVLLGTSTGSLFESEDGGHSWARLAHLGDGDDYVLDHIAFDPQDAKIIYVAAWSVANQQAGDVFRSHNGGKSWEAIPGMHGKSVRALAIAASDSKTVIAGAIDGVFRSQDGGKNWVKISQAAQGEIESLAVDPKDANVIYAGTWHLAWKTADGGANWEHIKQGMIEDSDVFSVIVDSDNPAVVFASACSGIYKSENAGELFKKIQGIPFTARRTRVLKQDPVNPQIVYAGTTEGLWRTADLGKTWKQVTGPEVVVNDVMVDPRNSSRVLLATDRGGVLASDNGAQSFSASNHGYTHRYVTSILASKIDPNTILVGVVNDREWGGVFASNDGGKSWAQKSSGLSGKDVFTLEETSRGDFVAGTSHGIYLLPAKGNQWQPINAIVNEKVSSRVVKKGARKTTVVTKTPIRSVLDARVNEIEITPRRWLAATTVGLFISSNDGKSWSGGPVLGKKEFSSVQAQGEFIAAASTTNVLLSADGGLTWQPSSLASYLSSIRNLTVTPEAQVIVASHDGAFGSSDSGATWRHLSNGLPDKNISSVTYDSSRKRLLATSTETGVVFVSENGGQKWHRGPDSGYPLRRISVVHGRFMAATPFDGVIVQPENEPQSAAADGGMAN